MDIDTEGEDGSVALHENIRAARLGKNMTQKELAAACGMCESTVRLYESVRGNPKPATVARLAAGLGVSPAELYGVGWVPGLERTGDGELDSALYRSMLGDAVPEDGAGRLLAAFGRLNGRGRAEAVKRVEELARLDEYAAPEGGGGA